MQIKLISIILGLVLVLGTGTLVYKTKKPPYIPPAADTTGTAVSGAVQTPSTTVNTVPKKAYGNYESEDDDYGGNTSPAPAVSTPAPANVPSQTTTQTGTSVGGIKLSQISQHNSRTSCWSAINGGVYDLTSWIPNHPGGEQTILSICGIDGSTRYNGQHGGNSKPMTILAGFKIGTLAI